MDDINDRAVERVFNQDKDALLRVLRKWYLGELQDDLVLWETVTELVNHEKQLMRAQEQNIPMWVG